MRVAISEAEDRDPLRRLTDDPSAPLRPGREAQAPVSDDRQGRHAGGGRDVRRSLGQHDLDLGQGAVRRPEPPEPARRARSAPGEPAALLDHVVEPPPAPVPGERRERRSQVPTSRRSTRRHLTSGALFAGLVSLHVVAWTVLPLICTHALPMDTAEGVIWGQGWQLGYVHPPLQAWILGGLGELFGNQRWAVYLASQLLITAGFVAVWRLAGLIVTPLGALVSVAMLEGVAFFNLMTPNLFPDLVELPFWALATWSFYRALRFGHRPDWVLLGLWLAGAAYAKYVGAILAVVMIAFMLVEPRARRSWRTAGPYVTAGLCLLLLAPHLWWIVLHDSSSIQRFGVSARPTSGIVQRLSGLAGFTFGELGLVAGAGLLALALRGAGRRDRPVPLAGAPTPFDRRFVATLALGPFFLTWLVAAVSGLWFRAHWGYAMWSFIGLFAVIFLVPAVGELDLRRFGSAWMGMFLLMAAAYGGSGVLAPYLLRGGDHPHLLRRVSMEATFPGRDLAEAITRGWHDKVGDRLPYVIGSKWLAGQVGFFAADRPLVLRDADPARSLWIDPEDVRRRGAVVVWDPRADFRTGGQYPGWLARSDPRQRFPTMEVQPPIVLPWKTAARLPPLEVRWGIVYPSLDERAEAPRS
jgi:hypothetical protein